jgi:hypothetical protein
MYTNITKLNLHVRKKLAPITADFFILVVKIFLFMLAVIYLHRVCCDHLSKDFDSAFFFTIKYLELLEYKEYDCFKHNCLRNLFEWKKI